MVAGQPTAYDYIGLAVASLGVLLGGASLIWNLFEFRLTGPHVKVTLLFGAVGPGGLVSKREPLTPNDMGNLASQGFTEPLVGVEVVNDGRSPTTVTRFSCQVTGGFGFVKPGLSINPELPCRIEPHTTTTFWIPG